MGLIPAHAGKIRRRPGADRRYRAHPRSRGENSRERAAQCILSGSSPLTRGKFREGTKRRARRRLIPAHAGKMAAWAPSAPSRPGSSPLTRGKFLGRNPAGAGLGLIPAHAGKMRDARTARYRNWAHPRSRGENMRGRPGGQAVPGSSPLTRGKSCSRPAPFPTTGLIPAHAGKMGGRERANGVGRAHPRSRGENDMVRGSLR